MTQSAQVYDFLAELKKRVSGDLRTDQYSRMFYSTDASIYQVMPHGVLFPKNSDDLHAAVELAAKHKVPLLPRTAGSSLAGQATNKALVMDMTRHLDKVLEVNTEEGWVRVQPGVVRDVLKLLDEGELALIRGVRHVESHPGASPRRRPVVPAGASPTAAT